MRKVARTLSRLGWQEFSLTPILGMQLPLADAIFHLVIAFMFLTLVSQFDNENWIESVRFLLERLSLTTSSKQLGMMAKMHSDNINGYDWICDDVLEGLDRNLIRDLDIKSLSTIDLVTVRTKFFENRDDVLLSPMKSVEVASSNEILNFKFKADKEFPNWAAFRYSINRQRKLMITVYRVREYSEEAKLKPETVRIPANKFKGDTEFHLRISCHAKRIVIRKHDIRSLDQLSMLQKLIISYDEELNTAIEYVRTINNITSKLTTVRFFCVIKNGNASTGSDLFFDFIKTAHRDDDFRQHIYSIYPIVIENSAIQISAILSDNPVTIAIVINYFTKYFGTKLDVKISQPRLEKNDSSFSHNLYVLPDVSLWYVEYSNGKRTRLKAISSIDQIPSKTNCSHFGIEKLDRLRSSVKSEFSITKSEFTIFSPKDFVRGVTELVLCPISRNLWKTKLIKFEVVQSSGLYTVTASFSFLSDKNLGNLAQFGDKFWMELDSVLGRLNTRYVTGAQSDQFESQISSTKDKDNDDYEEIRRIEKQDDQTVLPGIMSLSDTDFDIALKNYQKRIDKNESEGSCFWTAILIKNGWSYDIGDIRLTNQDVEDIADMLLHNFDLHGSVKLRLSQDKFPFGRPEKILTLCTTVSLKYFKRKEIVEFFQVLKQDLGYRAVVSVHISMSDTTNRAILEIFYYENSHTSILLNNLDNLHRLD